MCVICSIGCPALQSGVDRLRLQGAYWVNYLFGSSQYDEYGTNADLCSDETISIAPLGWISMHLPSGALHRLLASGS